MDELYNKRVCTTKKQCCISTIYTMIALITAGIISMITIFTLVPTDMSNRSIIYDIQHVDRDMYHGTVIYANKAQKQILNYCGTNSVVIWSDIVFGCRNESYILHLVQTRFDSPMSKQEQIATWITIIGVITNMALIILAVYINLGTKKVKV